VNSQTRNLKGMFRRGVFVDGGLPALGRFVVRHPFVVIGSWIAIALVLFLIVPPLAVVAQKHPPAFLPPNSPVLVAASEMKDAFKEGGGSSNIALVVLTNENGLTPQDEAVYRNLVAKLKNDTPDVMSTQDFVSIPEIRQVMTSKDNKAWNLPVSLTGTMGSGPGQASYRHVMKTVQEVTANTSLKANFVGAAATLNDVNSIGERDQHLIEISTVVLVLLILALVYRNVVAMLMPLITIGLGLVTAQFVVAGLGEIGLGLGPMTIVLMTGMMMGAGTDYAIFLFSRYHELIRTGLSSDDALVEALSTIGKVMAGSAGTVAIAFLGMSFTKLGIFATIGPALAVTVAIGFIASITLLPAQLAIAGRRGWVKPGKDLTSRFWRRSGINIVRRPVLHLVPSLIILLALASCASLVKYNYDDRTNLPDDAPSNRGYAAMSAHFPVSTTLQQFILIRSRTQDLRTPKALADMEQMAQRVSQLPHIDVVRGITRPTGEMLEQAKATYQAGEVGSKLQDASTLIASKDSDLSLLSGGARQLANVQAQIRDQVTAAVGPVRTLVGALDAMQTKYGGSKTIDQMDKSNQLISDIHALGDALGINLLRISDIYTWALPVVNALNVSPVCDADPGCVESRSDLQRIIDAHNDGTLDAIAALGRQLQTTHGSQSLNDSAHGIGKSMDDAVAAVKKLGVTSGNSVLQKLNTLQQGVDTLATAQSQLADGVKVLVDQTRVMGSGLDQASSFLLGMKQNAAEPPMSGFYIPPEILTQKDFEKAAKLFISPDGHTARYLVQTALNPFSTAAMDQVSQIVKTANSARPNTTLADAKISMVGFSPVNNDLRHYYNGDIRFIVLVTLIVVFIILVALLRAIVAPIYLVLSVVLSYVSALGIGVVFFQYVLGQQLAWSVPGMAFLVLVAVGADYNLLVISRIKDEARLGVRTGVIRTVGATGGVITSAGLIFAASMLALTVSSLNTVVQLGFIIGVGLLLDTFLVRTLTVPAIAVLIGNANWWPSKLAYALETPAAVPGGVPAKASVVGADDTDVLSEADTDVLGEAEDTDTEDLKTADPDADEASSAALEDEGA
jgi:putative drug exporter of the RND superfamily